MKHLLFFVLITIFLTACNSTQPAPAVSPAMTFDTSTLETSTYLTPDTPTPDTQAPTPSTTLRASPEATATPTEAPDPNMPPGATGKDAQGNYIKAVTENGKPVTYTSEAVPTGSNGETKNMWVTSHVINPTFNGGIPAIDQLGDGYQPKISIHFEVKEGILAPSLEHIQNPAPMNGATTFSNILYITLMERYFTKSFMKIPNSDMVQFGKDWNAGKISIPVTDANGNTYDLPINDKTQANIILVHPEDITSDFHLGFLSSVTSYKDGVLTIAVASTTPPESLSKEDFSFLILNTLMQIFVTQNQSLAYFNNNKVSLVQRLGQLENLAVNGQNPLFTIVTP